MLVIRFLQEQPTAWKSANKMNLNPRLEGGDRSCGTGMLANVFRSFFLHNGRSKTKIKSKIEGNTSLEHGPRDHLSVP